MKKVLKIIIILIIVILFINLLYGYICYRNNTLPKFAKEEAFLDGGTIEVIGIGYHYYLFNKLKDSFYDSDTEYKAFSIGIPINLDSAYNKLYKKACKKNNRTANLKYENDYLLYYKGINEEDRDYWNKIYDSGKIDYAENGIGYRDYEYLIPEIENYKKNTNLNQEKIKVIDKILDEYLIEKEKQEDFKKNARVVTDGVIAIDVNK